VRVCLSVSDEGDLKDLLPTDLLSHDEDLISILEEEDLGKTTAGEGPSLVVCVHPSYV